ncbi:MAG: cell wall hydrolase [Qipengyuania sp.]
MVRKTGILSAAAIAATMFFTVADVEGSGAWAQDAQAATQRPAEVAELTDEVVPVFVTGEVVQPLPDAKSPQKPHDDGAAEAASLSDLVSLTSTDGALSDELRCLAGAIYFESRGEPLAGQLAVAQVVINRTESPLFPDSYCSVVHQRAQFSFVKNGRMPSIGTGTAAWKRAKAIARIAHQGQWESEAEDSLYFHANYVRPGWARKKQARATIKTHIFYR